MDAKSTAGGRSVSVLSRATFRRDRASFERDTSNKSRPTWSADVPQQPAPDSGAQIASGQRKRRAERLSRILYSAFYAFDRVTPSRSAEVSTPAQNAAHAAGARIRRDKGPCIRRLLCPRICPSSVISRLLGRGSIACNARRRFAGRAETGSEEPIVATAFVVAPHLFTMPPVIRQYRGIK